MTPYRQKITLGDSGSDVLAVKRVLRAFHPTLAHELTMNRVAGDGFVSLLTRTQQQHGLRGDGVYGPASHHLIAPHFDAYGVWLYRTARLRAVGYQDPFEHARITYNGRIDEGVDFHGYGPITALGDAQILGDSGYGWPGGNYLGYRLLNGDHQGRIVYVAEAIIPAVRARQVVRAGQVVCYFGRDAAPGLFPGIETGWSSSTLNLTWAAVTTGYHGAATPAGLGFARLLQRVGVHNLGVGFGPEFPA